MIYQSDEVDDSASFNLGVQLPIEPLSFIEEGIFLGNFEGSQNLDLFRVNGITRVLSLLDDFSEFREFEGIRYGKVNISDKIKTDLLQVLPECLMFISDAQSKGEKIFVHCVAGISRSPSVLIAYFMVKYSVNYYNARNYVNKGRPGIYPNKGFISQLRNLDINAYSQYLIPNP